MDVGAVYLGQNSCQFTVWAPLKTKLSLRLPRTERSLPMEPVDRGYWQVVADSVEPGDRYLYELEDGQCLPDPASHSQPDGVHEASQVWDHSTFEWTDSQWKGLPLEDYVIYELHVGTFTPEGSFEAIIPRLPRLKELGITAIEIMPICSFPGDRNWGYDGVYPYAVHVAYGGPDGLKKLVDACHNIGMAVVLDVVYNHLGPEGNYFSQYGPYFVGKYRTPWGDAINFDDAHSDGVRHYFIQNAIHWFEHYHVDSLRLDAVHGIYDSRATHILADLATSVQIFAQETGRSLYLMPESDLNDVRLIRPAAEGGYGLDAQWTDDFHHALHALLTGEQQSYYQDYGNCGHLAQAIQEGFVYWGQYSPFRKRSHGSSSQLEPATRFIVCAQNHDQIGNRALGERLTQLVSFEQLKLAAATVLLSPFIPLLFMGEEYGEKAPFLYFISHTDPELVEAVRKGRQEEFPEAGWSESVADPQDPKVLQHSTLAWESQFSGESQSLWQFYQTLLRLRREHPVLQKRDKQNLKAWVDEDQRWVGVHRFWENHHLIYILNFSDRPQTMTPPVFEASWQKVLDSTAVEWNGSGDTLPQTLTGSTAITLPPYSVVVYDTSSTSSSSVS